MYSSTILTVIAAAAGLASAAPLTQRDTFFGVSIGVVTSAGLDPNKVIEPAPVEINVLTSCVGANNQGCSASELIVQNGTASNVDITQVKQLVSCSNPFDARQVLLIYSDSNDFLSEVQDGSTKTNFYIFFLIKHILTWAIF
jgi:hypothetical protein